MNETNKAKEIFFRWEADSRYFEKKPISYFQATTILAVLISFLLFFLKEGLLIVLVWIIYFVVYVRAVIPPVKTRYGLDKFGLRYYGGYLALKNMAAFSLIKKNHGQLLQIITQPSGYEYSVLLPTDKNEAENIIDFLKEKVPFVEQFPKSEVEKLTQFLNRLTGLG